MKLAWPGPRTGQTDDGEDKRAEATATSVRDRWREKGEHTVERMNE